jgi:TonB family protein
VKSKPHPKKFIEQPRYPGGRKALDEFIRTNLQYPEEAIKNKVQGTVNVKYDFDVHGKVIKAEVTHGIGYGCDEEALRLVKLLRFPKKVYRGLHVIFHQVISIHFRLPGSSLPPKQQELTIQYQYTESPKSQHGDGNISYTITPDE